MRRLFLLLAVGAAALVACGSDDNGGTIVGDTTDTTDAAGSLADAVLVVQRLDTGDQATLRCGPGEAAEGSGWLSEPSAAQAACSLLQDESVRARLIDGPPDDQMCTQMYGGPEEANVFGPFLGASVDARFHRSDGCGIADWDIFEVLIGPPGQ